MVIPVSLSPWLILLAVFLYGALHSLLASLQAKSLVQSRLGEWGWRCYRLAFNIIALLSLLPILALTALLPDLSLYTITFPWVILSLALQGLALLALLAGVRQTGVWSFLGLGQIVETDGEERSKLVVSGLYRWVRHPLYSASLVLIWLVPRMSVNLLALNAGLTIYLVVGAMFEERKLLREFGEAYARYRERTPMLIPGLRRASSS